MSQPKIHPDVVMREVDDEAVVYDFRTHKAHCLNRTALAVFRACDGRNPPSHIRKLVAAELGAPVDAVTVELALQQLEDTGLLCAPGPRGRRFDPSRRRALKRLGLGAAVAVPAIWSMLAPTPAYAASAMCIVANNCTPGSRACCGTPGSQAMACNGQGMCNANAVQCQGVICR